MNEEAKEEMIKALWKKLYDAEAINPGAGIEITHEEAELLGADIEEDIGPELYVE